MDFMKLDEILKKKIMIGKYVWVERCAKTLNATIQVWATIQNSHIVHLQ